MAGLGTGFIEGFNTMSNAIDNSRKLQMEKDKEIADENRFNKTLGMQREQLGATREYQNSMLGYQKDILGETVRAHNIENDINNKKLGLEEKKTNSAIEHDKTAAQAALINANSSALAHRAQADYYGAQLGQMKQETAQKARESNYVNSLNATRQLITNYAKFDDKGNIVDINIPDGQEADALELAKQAGLRISGGDPHKDANDYAIVHAALTSPQHREWIRQNAPDEALSAMNNVFGGVVQKRVGEKVADNKKIGNVELIGVHPGKDKSGKEIPNTHFLELREYYVHDDGTPYLDKKGNPEYSDGAMTQGRNDDPKALVTLFPDSVLAEQANRQHNLDMVVHQRPDILNRLRNFQIMQANEKRKTPSGLGTDRYKEIGSGSGVFYDAATDKNVRLGDIEKQIDTQNADDQAVNDQNIINAFRQKTNPNVSNIPKYVPNAINSTD